MEQKLTALPAMLKVLLGEEQQMVSSAISLPIGHNRDLIAHAERRELAQLRLTPDAANGIVRRAEQQKPGPRLEERLQLLQVHPVTLLLPDKRVQRRRTSPELNE